MKAFISAGSNLGDRMQNLQFAIAELSKGNSITRVSSCFETEPVGYLEQPWFLNIVIELDTEFSPLELLEYCQNIEASCGRIRSFQNAPRTLDLDILLFDDSVLNEERLVIPHPRLQERKFVLEPLAQIAPNLMHPIFMKSISALLKDCPDTSDIREIV